MRSAFNRNIHQLFYAFILASLLLSTFFGSTPPVVKAQNVNGTILPDNPSAWELSYSPPISMTDAIAVYDNKLYASGFDLDQSNGNLFVFDGSDWSNANFSPGAGVRVDMIESMLVFDDLLYIGTRVYTGGAYYARVYSYDGANFTEELSTAGASGYSGIENMAIHNNKLYAAVGAYDNGRVFQQNGAKDWSSVGDVIENGSPVRALASYNGDLYAGTGAGGNQAELWKWNGATWTLVENFNPAYGMDGIQNLAVYKGLLYIGFAGGNNPTHIPVYDGSTFVDTLTIEDCDGSRLSVSANRLWAGTCTDQVYVNDGNGWQEAGNLGYPAINTAYYNDHVYVTSYGAGKIFRSPFTDSNPVPAITSLSPSSTTAGGPDFTLTVNGDHFVSGSVVRWNGADRPTSFVSASQLSASIPAADITTAAAIPVTVFNPSPGGGASGSQAFTVNNMVPGLTNINPTSVVVGSDDLTLIVNGTYFTADSIVQWNESDLATTFVSITQLTATVPASLIAASGTANVTVFNPTPGGGTSDTLDFTILPGNPFTWQLSYTPPVAITAAIVAFHNKLYSSGFAKDQSNGNLFVFDGSNWDNANLSPGAGVRVDLIECMLVFNDTLYIGTRVYTGGAYYARVYSYNGSNFAEEFTTTGAGGYSGIENMAIHNNKLYAAVGAANNGRVFQQNGIKDWTSVGNVIEIGSPVRAVASFNGELFAGTGAGGNQAKLWKWNGSTWALVKNFFTDYGMDGIEDLETYNGLLYIGFAGGSTPSHIPVYDGSTFVDTLTIQDCGDARLSVTSNRLWAGTCTGQIYVNDGTGWQDAGKIGDGALYTAYYNDHVYLTTYGAGKIFRTPFTASYPIPMITSLSPSVDTVGAPPFILTVNGDHFVSGSVVHWNGVDRPTTYLSASKLIIAISADDLAIGAVIPVIVVNPLPGGGMSGVQTFTVNNLVPGLSGISPASVLVGSDGFILSVTGSNFVSTSVVRWNGTDLPTTFVDSAHLTATVPTSNLASMGIVSITIFTPLPGGGTSSPQTFTISNPAPILNEINPTSAVAGSDDLILTANGSNFSSDSSVRWNGSGLATTYVSDTQLTATVPASLIDADGTASVTVFNPVPGGGASGSLDFTILPGNPLTWELSYTPPVSITNPITVYHNKLYAGGSSGQSNGNLFVFDGSNWSNANLAPGAGITVDMIESMLVFNDILYIGTRINASGAYYARVYSYDGANFAEEFTTPGAGGYSGIESMAIHNNKLYVSVGAYNNGKVFQQNSIKDWTSVGNVIENGSPVRALASYNGALYAGTGAGGNQAKLWKWNGSTWLLIKNFYPAYGMDGIQNLATYKGLLYIAFAGGNTPTQIPVYDGSTFVDTLTVQDCGGTRISVTANRLWAGTCTDQVYVNDGNKWQEAGNLGYPALYTAYYKDHIYITSFGAGKVFRTPYALSNSIPAITGFNPSFAIAGNPAFTLTVNGDNFIAGSVVRWNGADRPTSYVSASQITASISAADISNAASIPVTIFNPSPNRVSEPAYFMISSITPVEGSTVLITRPALNWPDTPGAIGYNLQISTSNKFSSYLVNTTVASSAYVLASDLPRNVSIYWRTSPNGVSPSAWSKVHSFISANPPGVPSLLSPDNGALVTTYTPLLDWSTSTLPAGSAFDHYQLQIATDSLFNNVVQNLEVPGLVNSEKTLTGSLASNGTFYWRVCAWNMAGQYSPWSAPRYFRTPMLPPVLTALTAPKNLRPTFEWNTVSGATSYAIQVSTSSSFSSTIVNTTLFLPAYTPTSDLTPNKTLYWRVQAKGANPSAWSNPSSFASPNPPSTPSLSSPSDNSLVSNNTPRLDWSNSFLPLGTSFKYYLLQIATDSYFTNLVKEIQVNSLTSSEKALDTSMDPDGKYYWHVQSFNTEDETSTWSSTRSFRTKMLPPVLDEPGDTSSAKTTRPTFTWFAVPRATGYAIQISTVESFSSTVVNATVSASTYTPTTDLPRSKELYWRVHSDGLNPSDWSDFFTFKSANPPSVPSLMAPSDGITLSIYTPLLDWNDPVGAAHYEVQIATTSTFAGGTITIDYKPTNLEPSNYTPSPALAANSTFYWRVRVYNDTEQYSNWSAVRHFNTTLPAPELSTPADTATGIPLRPNFNWNEVNGATGYVIQVSTSTSFSTLTINKTVTGLSYLSTINLASGKNFYWRVYAKGTFNSPWSEVHYFTTQ